MMKFKTVFTALLLTGSWGAQAHTALHAGGFLQNMVHFLTEPDHLLLIGALAVTGYLLFRKADRSTRRSK